MNHLFGNEQTLNDLIAIGLKPLTMAIATRGALARRTVWCLPTL